MVFLGLSYDVPMIFLGLPQHFPMTSLWFSQDFPRLFLGFSNVLNIKGKDKSKHEKSQMKRQQVTNQNMKHQNMEKSKWNNSWYKKQLIEPIKTWTHHVGYSENCKGLFVDSKEANLLAQTL